MLCSLQDAVPHPNPVDAQPDWLFDIQHQPPSSHAETDAFTIRARHADSSTQPTAQQAPSGTEAGDAPLPWEEGYGAAQESSWPSSIFSDPSAEAVNGGAAHQQAVMQRDRESDEGRLQSGYVSDEASAPQPAGQEALGQQEAGAVQQGDDGSEPAARQSVERQASQHSRVPRRITSIVQHGSLYGLWD